VRKKIQNKRKKKETKKERNGNSTQKKVPSRNTINKNKCNVYQYGDQALVLFN
jgi:hypothetical protein